LDGWFFVDQGFSIKILKRKNEKKRYCFFGKKKNSAFSLNKAQCALFLVKGHLAPHFFFQHVACKSPHMLHIFFFFTFLISLLILFLFFFFFYFISFSYFFSILNSLILFFFFILFYSLISFIFYFLFLYLFYLVSLFHLFSLGFKNIPLHF
jgi:hypothetical protein